MIQALVSRAKGDRGQKAAVLRMITIQSSGLRSMWTVC